MSSSPPAGCCCAVSVSHDCDTEASVLPYPPLGVVAARAGFAAPRGIAPAPALAPPREAAPAVSICTPACPVLPLGACRSPATGAPPSLCRTCANPTPASGTATPATNINMYAKACDAGAVSPAPEGAPTAPPAPVDAVAGAAADADDATDAADFADRDAIGAAACRPLCRSREAGEVTVGAGVGGDTG